MKCFAPRSTTTQCARRPMRVRAARTATKSQLMITAFRLCHEVERLLFYRVISALSEHWTPFSTRAACPWRARRFHPRVGGILRDRGRRRRYVDAHDASRAGSQPIADQCGEVTGERDRGHAEPGRAADVRPRRPLRHGRPEPPDRAERAADDQRLDHPDQGGREGRSPAPDQRRRQGVHLRHAPIELRLAVLVLGHHGRRPAPSTPSRSSATSTRPRDALQTSESHLVSQKAQEQNLATQAPAQASQAKALVAANQQEAAATTATLSQVQGQLASRSRPGRRRRGPAGSGGGGQGRQRRRRRRGRPRRRKPRQRSPKRSAGAPAVRRRPPRPTRPAARPAGVHGKRRRHRVGNGATDGGRHRRGIPAGRPLCLRRGQPVAGLRLLGPGAMGLGAGRSLHPADDRGPMARPHPRLPRCARAG